MSHKSHKPSSNTLKTNVRDMYHKLNQQINCLGDKIGMILEKQAENITRRYKTSMSMDRLHGYDSGENTKKSIDERINDSEKHITELNTKTCSLTTKILNQDKIIKCLRLYISELENERSFFAQRIKEIKKENMYLRKNLETLRNVTIKTESRTEPSSKILITNPKSTRYYQNRPSITTNLSPQYKTDPLWDPSSAENTITIKNDKPKEKSTIQLPESKLNAVSPKVSSSKLMNLKKCSSNTMESLMKKVAITKLLDIFKECVDDVQKNWATTKLVKLERL